MGSCLRGTRFRSSSIRAGYQKGFLMDESTQSPVNRRRSTAGQDRTANSSTPGVRVPASLPEETAASAESGDRPGVKPATHASGEKGDGAHTGIVERVRERADAQLTTQKDMATDGIGTIARAIRGTTQELREQQHDTLAQYVDRAADELERLSSRSEKQRCGRSVPGRAEAGAPATGRVRRGRVCDRIAGRTILEELGASEQSPGQRIIARRPWGFTPRGTRNAWPR